MLEQALTDFLSAIADDPRICSTHISVYTALLKHWYEHGYNSPISVFGYQVMQLAKISGRATYQRSIKQLSEYGYIKYEPSFNHFEGSSIHILNIGQKDC